MNPNLKEKIIKLKKEKSAVILAHNYQEPDVQDIADFVGDSLDLSRKAKNIDASVIVFCGVKFMAETAKILSPEKKVLLPVITAGCPLADMVSPEDLINFKKEHPDWWIVSYVNTNADVKAVSDICCTSANAVSVIKKIPADKILFVPDKNLGSFVKSQIKDKEIKLWDGYCSVHVKINATLLKQVKELHPEAKVLVHPECEQEVIALADEVLSTNGMVKYVKNSNAKEFIIGTEEGIIHRLKKENPDKVFYTPGSNPVCTDMKKIHLQDVYNALVDEKFEISLPDEILNKAREPIEKMLSLS